MDGVHHPFSHRITWKAVAVGSCCAVAIAVLATGLVAQQTASAFRPSRVLGPQPPITSAPTATARQAANVLNPSELVIGVTVGDESRAYPINMLTGPSREIINDTLGGQAIAATW